MLKTIIFTAAVVGMILLSASQSVYADEDEICVDIDAAVREGKIEYDSSGDGLQDAIVCHIPQPAFDDCLRAEGNIWYDPRFEAADAQKILPDLDRKVNSDVDTLCIMIMYPYYNHQSWMDIPGWEEYRAVFPDTSKKVYADNMMIKNANNVVQFLKDNDATLWNDPPYRVGWPITAAIPTSLLPELADRDDVVKIDLWLKTLIIPFYIKNGYESKTSPLIHEEIKHGKKICTLDMTFDYCPKLERKEDGTFVVNVLIDFQDGAKQPDESLVDFLERNNQKVMSANSWFVHAHIAVDVLPEMDVRDDIRWISSGNMMYSYDPPSVWKPPIGISALDYVQPDHYVHMGSPLQQIKDGVAAQDVHCRNDLILTILQDGRPVCLTEPTALIMAERILGSRA